MNLQDALGVLSRASKYSVSTLRTDNTVDEFQKLKDHLYIIPDIQIEFEGELENALKRPHTNSLICLCGSSGDGKSEILTQLYKKFSHSIDFHLDATHSNSQHKSAIDCLDEKFDEFKLSNKPLAIGINIGMLQKFIKQGSERHDDIKESFEEYFENRHVKGFTAKAVSFYDFECYPRLNFSSSQVTSDFISKFLTKLTEETPNNSFYKYYQLENKTSSYVAKNFEVLSLASFQNKLIELFGLARLMEEQFLIPRIFVDFIYQILTMKNEDGIIGNVFTKFDNEFSRCFTKVDPINVRSQALDSFYLEYTTQTLSSEVQDDINILSSLTNFILTPEGIVRAAYLLGEETLKSSLADFSKESFLQESLTNYLGLIDIFQKSELTSEDEDLCLNIVEELIVNSALEYSNRLLPSKVDGFIVSRKLKDYSICNKVNIQADLEWIENHKLTSIDKIPIPLVINNEPVYIFNIDLNTMIQAVYISNGFRPNRQNLETIAKFDELISHIVDRTIKTESMKLISNNRTISVSKNRRRYTVEV
ncbi:DNA phosphorothioation-dependent restriction protein DptF [Colwellia sp. RSH04]|uniref:DNA phosphorothioation-dependent restriction protein DptF n=1 Tax=Colwellia sp. RSH04 TaxID=2305464 RepID=UPI000E593EC1|nr:DNA phosphorothioation-dependent restriction protein DptF [Colwellia sp. RSH04]RHW76735.1 DNA phosphorothioation-dependent restriction protein DptF [Colwellia sp. RSH04]